MGKIFFKKRDRIEQLERKIWSLQQHLEREAFPFQLTVPLITTKRGIEEVRFSGSPEAIRELEKSLDIRLKKRPIKRRKLNESISRNDK